MTTLSMNGTNGTHEPETLEEALALNKRLRAKEVRKAGERVEECFLIRKIAEVNQAYIEAVLRPEPRIKRLLLSPEDMSGPPIPIP